MSDKVFRDPLYNYIAFDRQRDGWLIELINCREVQRLHQLLKRKGYEVPAMYCLADKIDGKYLRPYIEEKEPQNQSAVNTIRVMVDGKPMAIGQHLPRLAAVIAKPEDSICYYVPKEIRDEAIKLSKRLRESTKRTNARGGQRRAGRKRVSDGANAQSRQTPDAPEP